MSEMTERIASVLVVEDEPLVSELVVGALTEAGFEVCAVANAADALQKFVDGLHPDILLTDINLTGEMDGSVLASCARSILPELAVVYVSGRVSGPEAFRAVPGGVFVPKPFDPFALGAMLARLVGLPGGTRPLPN
jgi:DNA-binding NtrC family response regulator